jgi:hypothetical protein
MDLKKELVMEYKMELLMVCMLELLKDQLKVKRSKECKMEDKMVYAMK